MLSKYQEQGFRSFGWFYGLWTEIPVRWDTTRKELYTLPRRKWISWYIGLCFIFILWYTCVHTLFSLPFIHRPKFSLLNLCILTTGLSVFSMTLFCAYAVTKLKKQMYIDHIRSFMDMEIEIYSRCRPELLDPNKKPTIFDFLFLIAFLTNSGPYVLFLVCMVWNMDGPYWVLEDISPDPTQRRSSTIFIFLGIRIFLLIPGFWEATRLMVGSVMVALVLILSLSNLMATLAAESMSLTPTLTSTELISIYNKLRILSSIFETLIGRGIFIAVNTCYILFIQYCWVCIRGWRKLDSTVYLWFIIFAFLLTLTEAVFLPAMAYTGEEALTLPNLIRFRISTEFAKRKSFKTRLLLKQAAAIQPIKYSYGGICPLGKCFTRNILSNELQNLFSIVLVFGIE